MMESNEPIITLTFDKLPVRIYDNAEQLARAAAHDAAAIIQDAIRERGEATIVPATGNSQKAYFEVLRTLPAIPWSRVRIIMVDQYLGVDESKLGTRVFLEQHLLRYIEPLAVHYLPSRPADLETTMHEYEVVLKRHPLDLASLGWGENGHLAFNDPHNADFEDPAWIKTVELSEESRHQPVGEGRFPSIDAVPTHAITLTIPALLSAKHVLCIVPEPRKAVAVRKCLEEPIEPERPGSILRRTKGAVAYLERASAAQLSRFTDL